MKRLLTLCLCVLCLLSCNNQRKKPFQPIEHHQYGESDGRFGHNRYHDEFLGDDAVCYVYANSFDGFVNIRRGPSAKTAILGKLRNGPNRATLLSREGNWSLIRYNGVVGYARSQYLQGSPVKPVTINVSMSWLVGIRYDDYGNALLIFNNGTYLKYSIGYEIVRSEVGYYQLEEDYILLSKIGERGHSSYFVRAHGEEQLKVKRWAEQIGPYGKKERIWASDEERYMAATYGELDSDQLSWSRADFNEDKAFTRSTIRRLE